MLHKKCYHQFKKLLPIPPMQVVKKEECLVNSCDPQTGEVLGQSVVTNFKTEILPEVSHVRKDTADMYSIENLAQMGIQPTICPTGGYMSKGLDALPEYEQALESAKQKIAESEVPVSTPLNDVKPQTTE